MTNKYYTEIVFPQVVYEVKDGRPINGTSQIMILHDNASHHKIAAVTQYLIENPI